ncbi:hypothetical protein [Sandarakinorhabdus limnophila]|nr:hypothetical protein [Sandarakinorhabdus limnophila]
MRTVYYRSDDVACFESVNGLLEVNPQRRASGVINTGESGTPFDRAGRYV